MFRIFVVLLFLFTFIPTANSAANDQIEEIVVTARKRSEPLQDVPIAIQVIDEKKIARYAATDLSEIADMSNNVMVVPLQSGSGGSLRIRGYGAGGDAGMMASVTTNADGVQITRGFIAHQAFFDLQSVQILKGPQAVIYGKDSPAGVITLVGAMPTDEFEARIYAGYETEAEEEIIEGFLSGPLIGKTLRGRLAVRASDIGGGWGKNVAPFMENSAGEVIPTEPFDIPGAPPGVEPNEAENLAFRATLDWHPSDNFSAVFRYLYGEREVIGRVGAELASCAGGDGIVRTNLIPFGPVVDPFEDCELNRVFSFSRPPVEIVRNFSANVKTADGRGYLEYEGHLPSLDMQWKFDWGSITSITALYKYDFDTLSTNDGGHSFPSYFGVVADYFETWSQELRFATELDNPLNVMLGFYWDTYDHEAFTAAKIAHFGPDPVTGFSNELHAEIDVEGESWSVFGQVFWDITEEWELGAGARYTDDEKDGTSQNTYTHQFFTGVFLPTDTVLSAKLEDEHVSPEVTLTWRPTSNLTFWGAYKTGYKSGGYSAPNTISVNATNDNVTFDPEIADGFEVGLKSQFLEGRIRLNLTAYSYDFEDLQVSVFDPVTTSFFISNAAEATTEGIEFDFQYLVNDHLQLYAEAGFNDGEYGSYSGASCYSGQPVGPGECVDIDGNGSGDFQDLSGTELVAAPQFTGSVGFEWTQPINWIPIGGNWEFRASGEAIYSDEFITSATGYPGAEQSSFWRTRARLGLSNENWSFAIVGRNLSDKNWPEFSENRPGGLPGDRIGGGSRPRQILLEVSYRY